MKKEIEDFLDYMDEINSYASYPTGFEDAIVGFTERCGQPSLILLDREKCIEILMKDMDEEEAIEYFEYNVLGSWIGESTPVFMTKIEGVI